MRRCRNYGWKNETRSWTVSKSSWRIVFWFTKGPWLPSCCTSLFHPIKPSSISSRWPTCGSSADASPGLVPPRPGWPCLDTDSATTIVFLLGELLNPRCTVLIFLIFSLEWTFWFSIFLQVLPQPAKQGIPSRAHGRRLRSLCQCLGRQVCWRQLMPPLGILALTTRRCLSLRAP